MSEAELLATFHDYLSQIQTLLFGYISFVSGFLIMSYLAASKLSERLVSLVLVLFSATCFSLIWRLFLVRNDFAQLNQYIREGIETGTLDLAWWGTNPAWGPQLLMGLDIFVTVGGFIGSIVFFLFQRRNSRRTQT